MIANALVFLSGALVAGLVALILYPAFTRRAARLARRELEQRLPRSLSEIAAEKDAIRAEYAARAAKTEVELRTARKSLVDERLARAEETAELLLLRADRRTYSEGLAAAEARVGEAREQLRARDEALARTAAENRDLERRLAGMNERLLDAEGRAAEAERIASDLRLAMVTADAIAVARDGGPVHPLDRTVERPADLSVAMAPVEPPPLRDPIAELLGPMAKPATPGAAPQPPGRIRSFPPLVGEADPETGASDEPQRRAPMQDGLEERIRTVLGVNRRRRDSGEGEVATAQPDAALPPQPDAALPSPPVAALPPPVAVDPAAEADHARRVEDLAARLRRLKARNATSRSRAEAVADGGGDGSPPDPSN